LDTKNTGSTADDVEYPIDFAWSSHITGINSLAGAEWTSSFTNTAGDAFLTQSPGRIVDGGQLGDNFIAYKTDAVVRVYETGDNFVLGFDSIFEDDGIYSTRCFTNIGNSQHLVVGNYGVYIHDGQAQRQDIAKGVFQNTLFDLVKESAKDRSFVFQQTRDKEVWFCFTESGTSNAGCNKAFVFNYLDQKVHVRTLPDLSDLYETEINGSLDILGAYAEGNIVKSLSSTTYESDGWFTRTNDSLEANGTFKEIVGLFPETTNAFLISVVASPTKLGDSEMTTLFDNSEKNYNPDTSYKVDTRVSGRFINLRVVMSGDINPKLTTLQFEARVSSRR